MLTKEQKYEQSLELRGGLADVTTLFLLENKGLNVNDVNILRSQVRKTEATYKVVKNTVVRLAVEGTEMEGITPFLSGPKVLAYTAGDGAALAKVLKTFIKDHPELSFEHLYLEGQILEAEDAEKMADLPSRDELIARLLQMLQSPIRRLAVALNAPLQQFASVIGQLADKGEEIQEPQETEEAPEAQEAQGAGEAPEAQEAQGAGEAEEAQEPQEASEAPTAEEAQEPQEASEAPTAEEAQEPREASEAPTAEEAQEPQEAPEVPTAEEAQEPQEAPEVPTAEEAQEPQEAPEVEEAQEPQESLKKQETQES
jgi:large subunit ribosomal protein L10